MRRYLFLIVDASSVEVNTVTDSGFRLGAVSALSRQDAEKTFLYQNGKLPRGQRVFFLGDTEYVRMDHRSPHGFTLGNYTHNLERAMYSALVAELQSTVHEARTSTSKFTRSRMHDRMVQLFDYAEKLGFPKDWADGVQVVDAWFE